MPRVDLDDARLLIHHEHECSFEGHDGERLVAGVQYQCAHVILSKPLDGFQSFGVITLEREVLGKQKGHCHKDSAHLRHAMVVARLTAMPQVKEAARIHGVDAAYLNH
jgi:hypothetical protein